MTPRNSASASNGSPAGAPATRTSAASVGPVDREMRGLRTHPSQQLRARRLAVAGQATGQPQVRRRPHPRQQRELRPDRGPPGRHPFENQHIRDGHRTPAVLELPGVPVVAAVRPGPAAPQRRRAPTPPAAARTSRCRPSRRAGRRCESRPASAPAARTAVARRAANVVFPAPAGPSTATSRTGPSRAGRARISAARSA